MWADTEITSLFEGNFIACSLNPENIYIAYEVSAGSVANYYVRTYGIDRTLLNTEQVWFEGIRPDWQGTIITGDELDYSGAIVLIQTRNNAIPDLSPIIGFVIDEEGQLVESIPILNADRIEQFSACSAGPGYVTLLLREIWRYETIPYRSDFRIQKVSVLPVGNDTSTMPVPKALLTCSPNPFNPSTTIAYSLPSVGDTTLRIYNTRGQMVKTLVHGQLEAGNHSVTWDGMDDKGKPVASGVYLVRLATPVGSQFSKCVLLK
jgi:hypothetical protein